MNPCIFSVLDRNSRRFIESFQIFDRNSPRFIASSRFPTEILQDSLNLPRFPTEIPQDSLNLPDFRPKFPKIHCIFQISDRNSPRFIASSRFPTEIPQDSFLTLCVSVQLCAFSVKQKRRLHSLHREGTEKHRVWIASLCTQ